MLQVLRFRVVPPLIAEARSEALQPLVLPLLLQIAARQPDQVGSLVRSTWSELQAMAGNDVVCCHLQFLLRTLRYKK